MLERSLNGHQAFAFAVAALCGSRESVLVLADDANQSNINGFIAAQKNGIAHGYAFGGEYWIGAGVLDACRQATG